MKVFTVGEETNHRVGDAGCVECLEPYPEPCPCGGLIHAAGGPDEEGEEDVVAITRCDRCGATEDDLDEMAPRG